MTYRPAVADAAGNAPVFVYEGAGCTGVAALPQYQALLGRKVDGAADFLDYSSTWANLVSSAKWAANCWKGQVANLSIGVPMGLAGGGSTQLADIAAGKDDAYYTSVAQALVQAGFPGAYLRIGWEFNGNWYVWAAKGRTATWIAAYHHLATLMRAVSGAHFKFVWNPALYVQQVDPSAVYPGDGYVDVVGTDAYNVSWDSGYADPHTRWAGVNGDKWGVAAVVAFAKAHGKPIAFPEWATGTRPDGHGGGDDPLYIANMAAVMASTDVAYQAYWDYDASDFDGLVSNGQNPATLAALMISFGSATAGRDSTSAFQHNAGSIVNGYAAPFATAAPLQVTATGCHAIALQNGPSHYELIPWTSGSTASCLLGWGKAPRASTLYRPQTSAYPAAGLGAVTGLTIDVGPNSAAIISLQF